MLTPDQVYAFLDTAKPGDKCVYYRGYLAGDRADLATGRTENDHQRRVSAIGDIAWAGYEARQVFLVQRKLAEREYEYVMLKRMRRDIERYRARHMPALSDDRLFGVQQGTNV